MRVVVFGASGNIGTATLDALQDDDRVTAIVGVARRPPAATGDADVGLDLRSKVTWIAADVSSDALEPIVEGADAVINLAWRIQPSWDVELQRRTNVDGGQRIFDAVAAASVPALVHASSVGAYAAGPKDRAVDEDWAIGGHPGHPYSLQKAEVESILDAFERDHPAVRVVRLRPGLVFQSRAGRELRRYFLPRHTPGWLLQPSVLARNPARFQAVHATDVAAAFVAAAVGDASGPFNIATDDVVGATSLPALEKVLRPAVWATWRLHLQPVDPGWVRLVFRCPIMDAGRAERQLGWQPRHSGHDAFAEGLRAMAHPPEPATPALAG